MCLWSKCYACFILSTQKKTTERNEEKKGTKSLIYLISNEFNAIYYYLLKMLHRHLLWLGQGKRETKRGLLRLKQLYI